MKFLFDAIVMWTLSPPLTPLSDTTPLPFIVNCIVPAGGSVVFPLLASIDVTFRFPEASAVTVIRSQPSALLSLLELSKKTSTVP